MTPEEMRRADEAAIAAGTPGHVLMERAGRAAAQAALALAGGHYGRRAAVVCGKGNNGGDGFVAARLLRRAGLAVVCAFVGDVTAIGGDALLHLERMRAAGVHPVGFEPPTLRGADVVVDALFGTGFRGPATGPAATAIEAVNDCGAPVVAVDVPSGVSGATGAVDGAAIRATVTVAMGAEKVGTALAPGALHAGRVVVADIGIGVFVREASVHLVEESDVAAALPPRPPGAHKKSAGSVVIFAGCEEILGAPLLAARGALRAGAGYVTLSSTPSVRRAAAVALPEAVTRGAGDAVAGPEALEAAGPLLDDAHAVAAGPGLGTGTPQATLVRRLLEEFDRALVLDADALNVLARDPAPLEGRRAPVVLTPHPAELARLLGTNTSDVVADPLAGACAAARRWPAAVVLLKGPRTVVADRGGARAAVVARGGAELATAGTGDVLTGAIAAVAAGGLGPFEAAWAGAWVHGAAGGLAAAARGPEAVAAGDVADELGRARAALHAKA